jgi:hypothetical protein
MASNKVQAQVQVKQLSRLGIYADLAGAAKALAVIRGGGVAVVFVVGGERGKAAGAFYRRKAIRLVGWSVVIK